MKNKKYRIIMEKPCSKDWNYMTATEKGMFCFQCSKLVVDLAFASDEEILKQMAGNDQFCGRFSQDQLDRVLLPAKSPSHHSFFSRLFSWLFLIASSGNVSAEPENKTVSVTLEENNRRDEKSANQQTGVTEALVKTDSLKANLQGIICDQQTQIPIPFVAVHIKNTEWKTITDSTGFFKFLLPDSMLMKDSIYLQLSDKGYYDNFIIEKINYHSTEKYCIANQVFRVGGAKAIVVEGKNESNPMPMWVKDIFDLLR